MEFLAERSTGATKAEIARNLGYPNNSVFRIVSTLEENGYAIRHSESNAYVLSRKVLSLGYKALMERNLVELAGDILRMTRDESRETALIGVPVEDVGVVLGQELSPEPIKITVSPGTRFPLHSAAPGKVLLAWLNEREREKRISRIDFIPFTSKTIVSPDVYREELGKVREQGYALDMEEEAEGVVCVAAPIFDYRGVPNAALWVTGPRFRLNDKRISQAAKIVKKHAASLSIRVGGNSSEDT